MAAEDRLWGSACAGSRTVGTAPATRGTATTGTRQGTEVLLDRLLASRGSSEVVLTTASDVRAADPEPHGQPRGRWAAPHGRRWGCHGRRARCARGCGRRSVPRSTSSLAAESSWQSTCRGGVHVRERRAAARHMPSPSIAGRTGSRSATGTRRPTCRQSTVCSRHRLSPTAKKKRKGGRAVVGYKLQVAMCWRPTSSAHRAR